MLPALTLCVAPYADDVPMPKRTSVDDFFDHLSDVQRPHLDTLRKLSRTVAPDAREELKWNQPMYVRGGKTNLWMLQAFKNHCSLRFSTDFFGPHIATVEAAGYDAGEGFLKLPYDREVPEELVQELMRARVDDVSAPGTRRG